MTVETEPPREDRLCSVVSKAAGDDPGGTAAAFGAYLGIELAPPWKSNVVESRYVPPNLLKTLERAVRAGGLGGATALMPDPEHSRPGHTRVLYFKRPAGGGPFAAYDKEEYLLPDAELASFVEALVEPSGLPRLERYRQAGAVRDILVCTHGTRDVCCGKFGYPVYEALRYGYAAGNPGVDPDLRVWRTSHIGGHRFAPTLIDFPEGRYWGHLEPEALERVVRRTGPVSELRQFYRGWPGVSAPFEQVAEREAFVHEGWGWTGYLKAGYTLSTTGDGRSAEVRIGYASPDGEVSGVYEATVEVGEGVMTLASSGPGPLEEAPQYRVSRLEKRSARRAGNIAITDSRPET